MSVVEAVIAKSVAVTVVKVVIFFMLHVVTSKAGNMV